MTTAGELWPSKSEYDLAIANWTETLFDPALRSAKLDYDHLGIRRYGGANLYVCIYRIGDSLIRCFCANGQRQPPVDIRERYQAIAVFCQQMGQRVSALTPLTYHERGLLVGTRVMPLVKMPFLQNFPSLGEFIVDHYEEASAMQQLTIAWLRMLGELEAAQVAHGDLDLSNVLVEQHAAALSLHLIDYDNMWVPALAGRVQTEYGHQHFQHPAFLPPRARPYTPDMDRFSALVIYLVLCTLVRQPDLYDQWGADESERLLFSSRDYRTIDLADNRIRQLREQSTPDLLPFVDELLAALREGRMPRSLAQIAPLPAHGQDRTPASWMLARASQPSLLAQPPSNRQNNEVRVMPISEKIPVVQPPARPRPQTEEIPVVQRQPTSRLWLWVLGGVCIGLLIVGLLLLLLRFVPGVRQFRVEAAQRAPALAMLLFAASSEARPSASINLSTRMLSPANCTEQGQSMLWQCQVQVSGSHLSPIDPATWQARLANGSSGISIQPAAGRLLASRTLVTISSLPCQAARIIFSGQTLTGQNLAPVTVFWSCQAANPTPVPHVPTPTPVSTPTATSTPTPLPTPTLAPTAPPSATPAGPTVAGGATPPTDSNPGSPSGSLPIGALLVTAAFLLTLASLALFLLPLPGEQRTLASKLRLFFLLDTQRRR